MSAIRLQSRLFRDLERGRLVKVGFLDTDKIHRIKRHKVEKFGTSGYETFGIPLKNPWRVRGGRGIGEHPKT